MTLVLFIFLLSAVNCQSLPYFQHLGSTLRNNSVVCYSAIGNGDSSLKCVTDSCNVGNWRDEKGRPVQQGADGASCLYVTRGDGVVSLNRKKNCTTDTSNGFRCDIRCSRKTHKLYVHIVSDESHGKILLCFICYVRMK